MDHDGARRLMAEAMEGRLSTDDERDLALHLVGCSDCKAVYEGLQHANPALTSIQLGEPSTQAVDAAVHRATTVLRGEADPGPMGLTDEAPRLPDELDANTVRIDSSGFGSDQEYEPAGPMVTTGPLTPPLAASGAVRPLAPPEAHVRAIEADPSPEPDVPAEIDAEIEAPPLAPPEDRDDSPLEPAYADLDAPSLADDLPVAPQPEQAPRSEIETLLDQDRTRFDPPPYEDDLDDERMSPGPWLIAIAVTVVLAVLAGFLIARGGSLIPGGGDDLPAASRVRSGVKRAFLDMKSLKTSYEIQKLSLYRLEREENSLKYSFSTGRWAGTIDYDRSEGYKQSFTLDVTGKEVQRAEVVQTSDETRSLIGTGADRTFVVEKNPPLGPPDGAFRPTLGLLEDSLATAAALLSEADDLEVLRIVESEGRQLYEVRATVPANELTRADRIEAALDGKFMPVIVKRSISRRNARVLGPENALSDADLDTAFGRNERITTELVELSNVRYDEIVLPGDLTLEAPDGIEEQARDANFERVTRAELGTKLDFEPLLPRSLSGDYEEQLFAAYTGEQREWGPGNAYPKPESVFQSQYFDGKTTIVLTQRRMPAKFNLTGSPLQRAGLPITVERVERDDKTFFFATSPEVTPHAYGFLGNVFVMASGYAPQEELIRMLASLAETPVDIPAAVGSPSPGTSPGASPLTSPTASPTASPTVTASPP